MNILIANTTLAGRTGTEIVTRDLAAGLRARGHNVTVFAPTLGPLADEISRAGTRVVSRLEDLTEPPDIVHGHHFFETVDALARFPGARGIFVCHDRTAAHSTPPRSARIHRYVAVDDDCLERLRDDWRVPPPQIRTVLNAVDTRRFLSRSPLPAKPTRALVFSNYAAPGTHDEVIRAACDRLGISVDVIGAGAGATSARPEAELGKFDLIFAKARCALESIASGAAVILCDVEGLGPMVTMAELARLRQWDFGRQLLGGPLDPESVISEINRYDPADATAVSVAIREAASLDLALDQYEALYAEVMREPIRAGDDVRSLTEPLLLRTARLEGELAALRKPERMRALSDDEVAKLRLTAVDLPKSVVAGSGVFMRVGVQNGLDFPIGSWPPFPLNLSYRWRPVESPQFLPSDARRSYLHRPIDRGLSNHYFVRVVAPPAPGRYVLRITLVQEGWRWLDEGPRPAFVDTDMIVTSPGLLTNIGR